MIERIGLREVPPRAPSIVGSFGASARLRAVDPDVVDTLQPIRAAGKMLAVGGQPFFVRGVTYGPFAPEPDGSEYHTPTEVDRDFAAISRHGFNTVRTYTVPPPWLFDIAQRHGLRVFVGLPWEQHVTFLDSQRGRDEIVARVRQGVAACSRHPAVLGYAVGNEIPPSIARWYGRRRIEQFVARLYETAKSEHSESLVTYVNFPTTEYLELPFLDYFAWNVYLETPDQLSSYLARLQNLAGEKPIVLTEIGLDSQRNGDHGQAASLEWQVRVAGSSGCAGAVVFAWTDEWHRSGQDILDWKFGLTGRDRQPKPALASVGAAFDQFPLAESVEWPVISVVVCSYNGARTIRETLEALCGLDYPSYEVIVVNDGSSDATPHIAAEFPVRLLSSSNRGLSHARNLGLRHAAGEIVAYIDDDAYPDRNWLRYIAHAFATTNHVAIGGPNISPPGDGFTAQCVSHAPGGPNHVLVSDTVAEHIPGCNMAFRRQALLDVGGFDPRFRIAGDDVDLCWRLQENRGTIGFHPAAMVWHHCRGSIRGYLKQQYNYGRAEAMLEAKWPAKYNAVGYPRWEGRIYGRGRRETISRRWKVHHGVWGTNLFQTLYMRPPGVVAWLPLLPEWYLLIAVLALSSALGILWSPLRWTIGPLLLAVGVQLALSSTAALRAPLPWQATGRWRRYREHGTIALLHLLQPVVRLCGRLNYGLHPLRRGTSRRRLALPVTRAHTEWSETWRNGENRLEALERRLKSLGARVRRGGAFDDWDLEVRGGLFGGMRLLLAIEEHGQGRQLVRTRSWPFLERWTLPTAAGLTALTALALAGGGRFAGIVFLVAGLLLVCRALFECAGASSLAETLTVPEAAANEEGPEESAANAPALLSRPQIAETRKS